MPADFADRTDFDNAIRGLVARLVPGVIKAADGQVVYDADVFARTMAGDCPETVHASLWRQCQLTAIQGLFEVTSGIYQIRGLDLSNMTLVEGEAGVIVIDPLISAEVAAAGLALYRKYRGERPVTAVIYTHSHIDHFGGVLGVVDNGTNVPILAPEHFLEHAVSENVYAGGAMLRRATYYGGTSLPVSATAKVGIGLGYGAECATWRNVYLTGAQELHSGIPAPAPVSSAGMATALTVTQLFDSVAIRIDGRRAWDTAASIRWHFTDSGETYRMELSNGTLIHYPTSRTEPADLVVTLTRPQLLAMLGGAGTDGVQFDGDPKAFAAIAGFTDQPDPSFPIVTP